MLIFLAFISTMWTFGLLRGARGAFGRYLAFERRYAGRAVSQIEHRDLDGAEPLQWDRDIGLCIEGRIDVALLDTAGRMQTDEARTGSTQGRSGNCAKSA